MISIIVPIYNALDNLPKLITSVIKQTFIDWELILVDDGSGNLKASGITIQNIVDNMIPYTTEEVQGILNEVFN